MLAILNFTKIAEMISNTKANENINFILTDQYNNIYFSTIRNRAEYNKWTNILAFDYKTNKLKSIIIPKNQMIAAYTNKFIFVLFIMSLIFSCVMAIIARLWQKNKLIQHNLEKNEN